MNTLKIKNNNNGLDGSEILIVREKFQDWWNTYKKPIGKMLPPWLEQVIFGIKLL